MNYCTAPSKDFKNQNILQDRRCRGRDRMVVGFITTYAYSAYHNKRCELDPAQGGCTRYNIM